VVSVAEYETITADQPRRGTPVQGDWANYLSMSRSDWPVRHIMNRQVLTCSPDLSVGQAAELMVARRCSSIVVVDAASVPLGIWTEHDALALDLPSADAGRRSIADVMTSPVLTVDADLPLEELVLRFRDHGTRHFVVTEQGALAGVISQTDVIRSQGVHAYLTVRDVGSLVEKAPLTVQGEDSLAAVMRTLRDRGGDAAVVLRQGQPYGIITERDILRLVASRREVGTTCQEVCSHPVLSVTSTTPLIQAHDLMEQHKIRHLVVLGPDQVLLSLLSFRDILAGIELDYTRYLQAALDRQHQVIRLGQERQRQIIEATLEGFAEVDREARIVRVNAALCHMLGYQAYDLIGQTPACFCTASSVEQFRSQFSRIDQQDHRSYDLMAVRRDGTQIPLRVNATTLRDEAGQVTGAFAFFTDQSEEQRQRNELQALLEQVSSSNADLESFAYVVSHDLQQPLRMVTSYLGLLTRRYSANVPPEGQEFIGYAVDGAKRMQSMIMDLLEYSRVNRRGSEFQPCDSNDCLALAVREVAVALQTCGGTVDIAPLPLVQADPLQIQRLFYCLLDNAIIYRDLQRPLRIRISAGRLPSGPWEFRVQDNGIGIEPQHNERVFQIFQRLHPRLEPQWGEAGANGRGNGNGIGLALSKRIVDRHHGEIHLESVAGEGTVVVFTLPAAEEGAA